MRPVQKLRVLLEQHGIYREAISLMRQIAEAVQRFEEGHYYQIRFRDGSTSYMWVQGQLANGAHRAIVSEFGGKPAFKSTNYLTPGQWDEITEADIPPRVLTRMQAKAAG
jgi:hypothetical protein